VTPDSTIGRRQARTRKRKAGYPDEIVRVPNSRALVVAENTSANRVIEFAEPAARSPRAGGP
jgi:hypothetical protein